MYKKRTKWFLYNLIGGAEEDRTLYLLNANQALSQVSYSPNINGRENRIRTCDPLFPKQVHYQAVLFPDMAR